MKKETKVRKRTSKVNSRESTYKPRKKDINQEPNERK